MMTGNRYKNFSVKHGDDGIVQAMLDVPGRPMNVLNLSVMNELNQIITWVENRSDVKLLVIGSAKESGFLAGADVAEIDKINSSERASQLLLSGQALFDRIERLAVKTLVLIHGPCLGGGLELALACDYRVARDNSSTKIGLPEIKLGLIPGWGGTQRLPKWVGLRKSLSMILTGKPLDASSAQRAGLIDKAICPTSWRDEVDKVMHRLANSDQHLTRPRRPRLRDWMLDSNPIGRHIVFSAARSRLSSQFEHYPALRSAITAIGDGYSKQRDGFATERDEFCRLLQTPTCRHLLSLFFYRESARKLATWSPRAIQAIHHAPVREIAVIGAGAMGAGIGQLAATRGYDAKLKEIDHSAMEEGHRRVMKLVDDYATHKRMSLEDKQQLASRIKVTDQWDEVGASDLVIEAVVEQIDVKRSVLAELEKRVSKSALLTTNTSSLSVDDMASQMQHPERFAGLHFFNPVNRMELVEVVRGSKTSDTTIAKLVSFVRALGKTPVVTADSPGFLVNRILFPYLGEAVLMASEGYRTTSIDRELRWFGMPMGPLELLDQVGLDVALFVARSLQSVLVDSDRVIEILAPMVIRGDTGRKSGRGFYDYGPKQKLPIQLDSERNTPPTAATCRPDGLTTIQRRLVYPMLAESIRCLDEGVVDESWIIDLAMVLGTGFAPHRGGPISLIDSIGSDRFLENQAALEERHGLRFKAPAMEKYEAAHS